MLSISWLEYTCQCCGETATCGPTQADIERIVSKICGACEQDMIALDLAVRPPPPTLRDTLGPIIDHDENPDRDLHDLDRGGCSSRLGYGAWCSLRAGHDGECASVTAPVQGPSRNPDRKFVPDTPRYGVPFNRGGWVEYRAPKPKDGE